MNPRRHNSNLALARRNDSRTIGTDEARLAALPQEGGGLDHIERRNAFRDAHDKRHIGGGGFHDGICSKRRRDEDQRAVGAGLIQGFFDGVEDRPAFVRAAAFARGYATGDLRSVLGAGLSVERAFAAGQALHDHASRFINQDAHFFSVYRPITLPSGSLIHAKVPPPGTGAGPTSLFPPTASALAMVPARSSTIT